jgi:hypothetical protein
MAADKKQEQIAVHVSADVKRAIARLAETEGLSSSEYVTRLIEDDLAGKRRLMCSLLDALGPCEGTMSSGERP